MAQAFLVVAVVPDLGGRDGRGRGLVRVGDGEAVCGATGDLARVARRHVLLDHMILNFRLCAAYLLILGQAVPYGHKSRCGDVLGCNVDPIRAIRALLERERNARRTDAVLVVRVVPDLGGHDGGGLDYVSVDDSIRARHVGGLHRGDVALGCGGLFHEVGDCLVVGRPDRQARPAHGAGIGIVCRRGV